MLGKADGDGEIGDDAILRISLTGIAVETGRKIYRDDENVLLATPAIDLLSGGADRFAQEMFGPEAKQPIENDCVRMW